MAANSKDFVADSNYGNNNVVAEALSRVCFRESPTSSFDGSRIEVDMSIQNLPATPAKLQEIRDVTNENITISHLKNVIYHGYSKHRKDCPHDLNEY